MGAPAAGTVDAGDRRSSGPGRPQLATVVGVAWPLLVVAAWALLPSGELAGSALSAAQLPVFVAVVVVAGRRSRSQPGRGWALVSAAAAVFAAMQVVLLASVRASGAELPPVAAAVAGTGAVLMALGCLRLACGPRSGVRLWRVLADALAVSTSLLLVVVVVLESVHGEGPARPTAAGVAALVNLLVVCLLVAALVQQPGRRSLGWVALALAAVTLGDIDVAWHAASGSGGPEPWVRFVFASSAGWFLAGALDRDRVRPGSSIGPVTGAGRLVVPGTLLVGLAAAAGAFAATGGLSPLLVVLLLLTGLALAVDLAVSQAEARGLVAALEVANRSLEARGAQVRTAAAQVEGVLELAPVGYCVVDATGTIRIANPALGRIFGLDAADLVGADVGRLHATHGTEADLAGTAEVLERLAAAVDDAEVVSRIRTAQGDERVVAYRTSPFPSPDGEAGMLLCSVEDVTERLGHLAHLDHLAGHDALTGLWNRRRLSERLTDAVAAGSTGTLVLFDLDDFKAVNDTLGHSAGDLLLTSVAERLRTLPVAGAVPARLGGDEFCVLVADGADRHLPELVGAHLAGTYDLAGRAVRVTCSVGAARLRAGAGAEVLLAEADTAMYDAKRRGPARSAWFRTEMATSAAADRRLTDDLHDALDRDQLVVWFQPVVDLVDGRTVGHEALVRWQHPERGLVTAAEFMGAVERTRLVDRLGEVVLGRALAAAAGDPSDRRQVAVNLSAAQLADGSAVACVARALRSSGIDADRVWVEVTETALLADVRAGTATVQRLRTLGVHVTIDDFGTGYGTLVHLQQLPVEGIKVDRAFVAGLATRPPDAAIVSALRTLSDGLGLACTAEGVETERQADELRRLGVRCAQGYLFGRPGPERLDGAVPGRVAAWAGADDRPAGTVRGVG